VDRGHDLKSSKASCTSGRIRAIADELDLQLASSIARSAATLAFAFEFRSIVELVGRRAKRCGIGDGARRSHARLAFASFKGAGNHHWFEIHRSHPMTVCPDGVEG
jgi:hypothetical protein